MPASTRRTFLASVAAAGVAAPLAATVRPRGVAPLKILVLGGTAFLGPPFVRAARANGHTVTLFNRGKTNPELFKDLEQLRGDRETGDLDALKGREFDVAIDTSGYVPAHVEASARLLAGVKHYQFISTISVYGGFGQRPDRIDENAETPDVPEDKAKEAAAVNEIRKAMPFYGALKARCEKAAEAALPGKVCVLRPGLIVGPGDTSDRFTWWPVRCDRGGAVLAPGDPDGHVQFVDVRDLAAFMLHCAEQGATGTMNVTGFAGRVSMAEVLGACKCATDKAVELVWASEEFLAENKVQPYMQMPLWIPRDGRSVVDCSRAIAAGLKFRPIGETVRDTLQWARSERGDKPFARTGLPAAREAELVAKWRAQVAGGAEKK
ncbi:MAG: NAD-dependent epimerase/dehydratase family protein [Planctomycetes bacterium]|nr:NAD-dependent epimerase/dehydratase family protein [Planctomycetota bacterium]